eukprot:gene34552-41835_t
MGLDYPIYKLIEALVLVVVIGVISFVTNGFYSESQHQLEGTPGKHAAESSSAPANIRKLLASAPSQEYTSSLLSYISFFYINRLLISPNLKKDAMEFEDVPRLHEDDSTESSYSTFQNILHQQHSLNLATALFKLIWPVWSEQAFFQWVSCTSNFISPLALEKVMIFVHCDGDISCYNSRGFLAVPPYIAAFMLLLGPLIKCASEGQNYVRGRHIGVRVRAALIGSIFKKSISVDLSASQESVGKLNNLISVDVGEIQYFFSYSNFLWSTLYEIFVAITLLCLVLGEAAFAGVIAMLLFMVVGFWLGAKLEGFQIKLLSKKDKRIATINEVLNSVRIIKYFAWEGKFIDKINDARLEELAVQLVYSATGATLFVVWEVVHSVVSMVAFLAYTQLQGRTLSPSLGFTALTLFNTLRFSLSQFPDIVTTYISARTSLRRIQDYVATDDVPGLPGSPPQVGQKGSIVVKNLKIAWRKVQQEEEATESKDGKKMQCCQYVYEAAAGRMGQLCSFGMSDGGSTYPAPLTSAQAGTRYSQLPDEEIAIDVEAPTDDNRSSPQLHDIHVVLRDVNIHIRPGGLNVIIGPTGAGKSTLLSAILGETLLLGGERFMIGEVAYSTQSAWIQNDTLRDNILFGSPFDAARYDKVIKVCALEEDLKLLPRGDLTEIGEKGVNLSGGQKQRVSLARAAYVRSDIIILDDPLSAVDAHVGEHIFRELILDFLRDRTVLLVTHQLAISLAAADSVVYVDQQTVLHQCPPQELLRELQPLVGSSQMVTEDRPSFMKVVYDALAQIYGESSTQTGCSNFVPAPPEVKRELSVEEIMEKEEDIDLLTENSSSNRAVTIQEAASLKKSEEISKDTNHAHKIIAKETKNKGRVTWRTYWFYFKALGGVLPVIVL